jgi:hypothetical protein
MLVTGISLSYAFLGLAIIALIFFIYFKVLVTKSSPDQPGNEAIIGAMKNPETWRYRNNRMAYLSLFWTLVSAGAFAFLRFYYPTALISIMIPFAYIGLIAVSTSYISSRHKTIAH